MSEDEDNEENEEIVHGLVLQREQLFCTVAVKHKNNAMSILPEEILSSVQRSMKTKKTTTRGRSATKKKADDEFRVREVAIEEEVETLTDFDENIHAELACDVYNLDKKVIIVAPIAGTKMDDLRVKVAEDVITIRGVRTNPIDADDEEIHTEECFWGEFSRSIILPPNVDTSKVKATYKNAVLIIELTKIQSTKERVIKIVAG